MDKSEFGKRLKKARIARRMTQSELAGDKVTRNMISRIENGVSVPSIGTLEYLAGRLDVPISVLVPQDGDGETLTAAKARFSANEFDKVIEMLEPVAVHGFGKFEFYDEACALQNRILRSPSRPTTSEKDCAWQNSAAKLPTSAFIQTTPFSKRRLTYFPTLR